MTNDHGAEELLIAVLRDGGEAIGGCPYMDTDPDAHLERIFDCSVATNNVLNPFTPFGDASLFRMANFYANVAHAGISEFDPCLDLVTDLPARPMNLRDCGIAPGNPADLIILDTDSGTNAIAELPVMLMGFKKGRQVFERKRPTLFPPKP